MVAQHSKSHLQHSAGRRPAHLLMVSQAAAHVAYIWLSLCCCFHFFMVFDKTKDASLSRLQPHHLQHLECIIEQSQRCKQSQRCSQLECTNRHRLSEEGSIHPWRMFIPCKAQQGRSCYLRKHSAGCSGCPTCVKAFTCALLLQQLLLVLMTCSYSSLVSNQQMGL